MGHRSEMALSCTILLPSGLSLVGLGLGRSISSRPLWPSAGVVLVSRQRTLRRMHLGSI